MLAVKDRLGMLARLLLLVLLVVLLSLDLRGMAPVLGLLPNGALDFLGMLIPVLLLLLAAAAAVVEGVVPLRRVLREGALSSSSLSAKALLSLRPSTSSSSLS